MSPILSLIRLLESFEIVCDQNVNFNEQHGTENQACFLKRRKYEKRKSTEKKISDNSKYVQRMKKVREKRTGFQKETNNIKNNKRKKETRNQ